MIRYDSITINVSKATTNIFFQTYGNLFYFYGYLFFNRYIYNYISTCSIYPLSTRRKSFHI